MASFKEKYDFFFGKGFYDRLRRSNITGFYLRVNISKISIDEFRKFLDRNRVKYKSTFIENCIFIKKSFFNLSSTLYFHNGMIYFQDLSSQIPVWGLLDWIKKRDNLRILDMAAAPGSKLTQLADFLTAFGKKFSIVALEPNRFRVIKLLNNLQRHDFSNIEVINIKGEDFVSDRNFDLILLDAPCSGSLLMESDWEGKRSVKGILEKSRVQKELLYKASQLVKKDGILVYSTCSLEPEEDEEVVKYGIEKLGLKIFKPFELEKNFVVRKYGEIAENCYRIMPFYYNTLPFFLAYFKK